MTKSESKTSIQCDKCHKWIKYNYYYGYSHRCSGRTEETCRAVHRRFYSINSLRNRDAQIFGMYDLAGDLDSASVMYDPTANKLLKKDIGMNNHKKDRIKDLVRSIDHAKERILYFERLKRNRPSEIIKMGMKL